jgi:hypothetical protein
MHFKILGLAAAFFWMSPTVAVDFAHRGGPEPANIEAVSKQLNADPFDMELLISFGTSKGGSAGHLALAIRDQTTDDDLVYSANFYADRDPKHAEHFYTENLMVRIPKNEYLFKTSSSLGENASFGLDFGEIYKRSVIGIRVYGVPAEEKAALAAYFQRFNDDFHTRASNVEYHLGEVKYDYLRLNCAKTIGSAFRFGAGYTELAVSNPWLFTNIRALAALRSNIPTEMAMKLVEAWNKRGYSMDVVLYKKYAGSSYVDPHEEEKISFGDLPNRFPSVLSRDFRREAGAYEDYDNLYAMYLLFNMGKYSVWIDERTKRLEIEKSKQPMTYPTAVQLAVESARSDSDSYRRGLIFRAKGTRIGEPPNNTHLYNYTAKDKVD